MNIDLLIVEDQDDERITIERVAKRYSLTTISFSSGLVALRYLKQQDKKALPRAYLVDMRTGISEEELKSPLEIFKFLESHDHIKSFRFHTGHFSEHDRLVQGLTKAKVILKASADFHIFLEQLKSSR